MKIKRHELIRNIISTILAFAIVGIYALIALNLAIFNPVAQVMRDYSINDFYYQMLGMSEAKDTSHVVSIVDISNHKERRDVAQVLHNVSLQEPKVIGVDVLFKGTKPDKEGDSLMAVEAANTANAVFACELLYEAFDKPVCHEVSRSFFADSMPTIKEGFVNMPRHLQGGIKRSFPLARKVNENLRPSMIKVLADAYAGRETLPLEDRELGINFSPIAFRVIPSDSISYYPEYLTDRIVIIGDVHDETDMHITPQGRLAGSKLLGYGIETVLKHIEIKKAPWWLTAVVSFILVLITKIFFEKYLRYVDNKKNPYLKMLLKTVLVIGLMKLFWMALLMWIAFLLFYHFSFSINLAWALSAIAFTGSADSFYNTVKNSLTN